MIDIVIDYIVDKKRLYIVKQSDFGLDVRSKRQSRRLDNRRLEATIQIHIAFRYLGPIIDRINNATIAFERIGFRQILINGTNILVPVCVGYPNVYRTRVSQSENYYL